MKKQTFLPLAISAIMLAASPAVATIIDSVNADKTPFADIVVGMGEIGWVYTPQFSYTLTGIKSFFETASAPGYDWGAMVEFEIYDEVPINGGALLRSATFPIGSHKWSSGAITPLDIFAGDDYFVGFRHFLPGFDPNFILCNFADSGVSLPAYYGTDNSGAYSIATDNNFFIHPILLFEGIPEPTTLLLLALGGLMLRRPKRQAK